MHEDELTRLAHRFVALAPFVLPESFQVDVVVDHDVDAPELTFTANVTVSVESISSHRCRRFVWSPHPPREDELDDLVIRELQLVQRELLKQLLHNKAPLVQFVVPTRAQAAAMRRALGVK